MDIDVDVLHSEKLKNTNTTTATLSSSTNTFSIFTPSWFSEKTFVYRRQHEWNERCPELAFKYKWAQEAQSRMHEKEVI